MRAALVALGVATLALAGCQGDHHGAAPAAAGTGAHLDGCTVVTTRLLDSDLGLSLSGDGGSSPSYFGEDHVSDCTWFANPTSVSVYATDRAGSDLPDGAIDGYLDSGGQPVPGADRGVAHVASDADGSNVDLIVVKGQLGIELSASSPTPMTQAQALTLGQHVLAALP